MLCLLSILQYNLRKELSSLEDPLQGEDVGFFILTNDAKCLACDFLQAKRQLYRK